MEVSALKHAGVAGMGARSPFLRLQPDERLIALTRRGSHGAFEALVARYQPRLLAFCRHMLGSKEDAEDVLQEVFAAAFNAMLADERPINARPWLYRISRNRCLNHLRRTQAIGVDSMDVHLSEHGLTTADKVHRREDFRLLLEDVQGLPETQRTALLLREIDALSYEQIAEAMETTVPSVKSLLVRARVSLAEASEARKLTCEEVRLELGEVAEGLRRTSPPARRHLKACPRCSTFRDELKQTNKALAAIFPVGPLILFKKFLVAHIGGAGAAGGAAGTATVAGGTAASSAGLIGAGAGAVVSKAAAGLAAAAIVTAGAVEVQHVARQAPDRPAVAAQAPALTPPAPARIERQPAPAGPAEAVLPARPAPTAQPASAKPEVVKKDTAAPAPARPRPIPPAPAAPAPTQAVAAPVPGATVPPTQEDSATTVLPVVEPVPAPVIPPTESGPPKPPEPPVVASPPATTTPPATAATDPPASTEPAASAEEPPSGLTDEPATDAPAPAATDAAPAADATGDPADADADAPDPAAPPAG